MLARYGFNPGSKFGDTMHFDFIEGYNDLIVGGRKAAENMRMDRASPENGLPPSTAGSPINPLPPTLRAPTPPLSPLSLPPVPMPPIWQVPLTSP